MNRLIVFIMVMLLGETVFGGDISRKGTTGSEHLLIPVGARSIATSGAFVANTAGVEAIFYNPAGLAASPREAMFSFTNYIADINVSYFAIGMKLGDIGSFGFSLKSLDFGDIPVTTYENPDGTGATYSPSYSVVGLTFAREVTDRVTVGVNAKLVHEGIVSTSANGLAFDIGVQYKFLGNLWLGVSLKNLGGDLTFEGQDLQTKTTIPNTAQNTYGQGLYAPPIEPFQLPSYFEISMAYDLKMPGTDLLVGATFHNYNSYEDAIDAGVELKLINMIFLRGGYNYLLENNASNQYGASFGAGVEYGVSGLTVCVDYAYRATKDFSGNNILALKLKF